MNRAVTAARRAFDEGPWPRMSPSERGRVLWKIADLIEEHLDEFAELESLDNGKPFSVARVADVPLTVDMFRYMGGWATKISGKTLPLSAGYDFHSYTLREPIGVVAQIIPWNFPLLMAAWKLAPALACGCTIVLKLAEQTPLSGLRLAQVLRRSRSAGRRGQRDYRLRRRQPARRWPLTRWSTRWPLPDPPKWAS